MADLSPWDHADDFSAYEVAALILGMEPLATPSQRDALHNGRVWPVLNRLEKEYHRACQAPSSGLRSIRLLELASDRGFADWLESEDALVERQRFLRDEIARWLDATGTKSIFQFEKYPSPADDEIDRADYPEELDAAMIAFRAVAKGYGEPGASFKERLRDYLMKHYPRLSGEAVDRLAIVANRDKAPGRKKHNGK